MRLRLGVLAALLATACALVVAPTVAAAPPTGGTTLTAPVTGTATDALGVVNTVTGTLNITGFAVQNGQLVALGTLTATVTDALGNVIGSITQAVSVPVTASGTCTILDLTLGPLHLNLLGLVVDLNQVHLQITAQSGPGNLLGNLLCGVAHLLDGGLNLTAIANLLNGILGAL